MKKVNLEKQLKVVVLESKSGHLTAYFQNMPGLVVTAEKIEDIPEQLAKSIHCFLEYSFKENLHTIEKLPI